MSWGWLAGRRGRTREYKLQLALLPSYNPHLGLYHQLANSKAVERTVIIELDSASLLFFIRDTIPTTVTDVLFDINIASGNNVKPNRGCCMILYIGIWCSPLEFLYHQVFHSNCDQITDWGETWLRTRATKLSQKKRQIWNDPVTTVTQTSPRSSLCEYIMICSIHDWRIYHRKCIC